MDVLENMIDRIRAGETSDVDIENLTNQLTVLEQGKSIEAAKALLGHESSETTRIYVVGADQESESDELFI
mgnify:CR=1 FL=1